METMIVCPPDILEYFDRNLLQTPMPRSIHNIFCREEEIVFSLEDLWTKKYKELIGFPEVTRGCKFNRTENILNDSWVLNLKKTRGEMEFEEEISFIKNLYEKTAKDLEEMQNQHLSSLICEMKRFIKVYEAKLEQDSRLTNLKWKIERQKSLEDREDSERDYEDQDDE